MKRILLGFAALVSVVGIGSGGVFMAHRMYTASAATAVGPSSVPVTAARDVTPTPIPLTASPSTDPPAAQSAVEQTASVPQGRYADTSASVFSSAQSESRSEPASAAADEIPDAGSPAESEDLAPREFAPAAAREQMPATRSADPFGRRPRATEAESRYPERPTAAEMAEVDDRGANARDDISDSNSPHGDRVQETGGAEDRARTVDDEPRPLRSASRDLREDRLGPRRAIEDQSRDQTRTADRDASADEPAELQADGGDVPNGQPPSGDQGVEDEGTGLPGDAQLNGAQAPTLTIEKTAPPEIQIGKAAKFTIKVRNTGTVVAQGVEIHDKVPQGTQFVDATPEAHRGQQGTLVWELGSLQPGSEQKIELQLMPTAEGEIGSVATVHFRAEASVRTVATKPMLTMEVNGPSQVMKGEEAHFKIRLSNPGSGAATGVVLTDAVPQGLSHVAGQELEFEVGTLKPGESRDLELSLMAAVAGPVTNVVTAQGDANLQVESRAELEVVAPQLQVSMTGPKRRYLERNAMHNISVSNPGTAAAKDIELVAVLPKELKFVEANNGGQFDEATHSVYWSLEELPPQETGTVTLTTLPQQTGSAKLLIKSKAQQGLADHREEVVAIEGLAAINFQLSDVNDPIEVGGQTGYEIRVTNQGSKAAANVRIVAQLPREMKPLSAEGPVRYKIDGQRVIFEPLKQLAPKADTSFTIKAQALETGDLRVQVQITTDEIREPITKEESTRVYGDE